MEFWEILLISWIINCLEQSFIFLSHYLHQLNFLLENVDFSFTVVIYSSIQQMSLYEDCQGRNKLKQFTCALSYVIKYTARMLENKVLSTFHGLDD